MLERGDEIIYLPLFFFSLSIADPPPRETLLHFAARLGLSQFAQQLLDKAGSDVALRLPNKNGELASDLARARGLEDLAERMIE